MNLVKLHELWDSRADLGIEAGTRDLIAKQLEIEAISKYVKEGMTILDAGCGNGITAIELAKAYEVNIIGVDFAPKMIESATTELTKTHNLKGKVVFKEEDITEPILPFQSIFDIVYTERVIINFGDWPIQKSVIETLGTYLKPGGFYIMCECSQDGLDKINSLRHQIGLPAINPPWHNHYLRDAEVEGSSIQGLHLERVEDFSSTYYFLSRVVNAWLSAQESKEPNYNSPINALALKLPSFSDLGQVKLWIWKKEIQGAGR